MSTSENANPQGPLVGIVMGSDSDWPTVQPAAEVLAEFGVPMEVGVVSAHRTPERMLDYARTAHTKGIKVIIACAGGAAHLPGMIAAATPLPVIGVPRALGNLDGLDSLLSIVQMPAGVPTATVSIDGAKNAGLLAVRTLAVADDRLMEQMVRYQELMRDQVLEKDTALQNKLLGGR
ncbi:5-(carboxyamino)imidazole ribonucleotide mutase [Corynebacterium urogenitale]